MPPADQMPAEQRESQLAELLEHMTAELRAGRPPDIEALARERPELSAELRELWAAVQVAEGIAAGHFPEASG